MSQGYEMDVLCGMDQPWISAMYLRMIKPEDECKYAGHQTV